MLFKVNINNLGKLKDAEVQIGKFTIFAGANNTGKSYVSKALYSLFGAMNANHLAVSMGPIVRGLRGALDRMERVDDFEENTTLKEMISVVSVLNNTINNVSADADTDEFAAINQALPTIFKYVEQISNIAPLLQKEASEFIESVDVQIDEDGETSFYTIDKDNIEQMEKWVATLKEQTKKTSQDFVMDGLKNEIIRNFLQNFQVPRLSNLSNGEEGMNFDISSDISTIGNVKIQNGSKVTLEQYTAAGLHQLQKYSKVLYLESPVFWRMKLPLDMMRKKSHYSPSHKNELLGVPKYVYDMYDAIESKYSGDIICPDVLKNLTEKVLHGKIVLSDTGELFFQEKEIATPLSLAAMGVANLGMLAFLIEHNLLDENTFLFVDEPEAHLHPAWQVEMVEALYKLSEAGVNIVIATHSPDIMKWLEVHVKKGRETKDIALNHFHDGTVQSHYDDTEQNRKDGLLDQIRTIQKELTDPYFGLYVDGL